MNRMIMGFLLCLVLFLAVALMLPDMAAAQDIHYLRRAWPVEPVREDLDCAWVELYPINGGGIWVEEYIDSDGDEAFSIGDVIDAGENGTYTIIWIGYGLDLQETEGAQEWLTVESTEGVYPPPFDPVGDTWMTIWPEFGNEYLVENHIDPDANGLDLYDEILLNGMYYEVMWIEMDVQTIWEEDEPPQPTMESNWSAVKRSYR